jgi:hypothetical protein
VSTQIVNYSFSLSKTRGKPWSVSDVRRDEREVIRGFDGLKLDEFVRSIEELESGADRMASPESARGGDDGGGNMTLRSGRILYPESEPESENEMNGEKMVVDGVGNLTLRSGRIVCPRPEFESDNEVNGEKSPDRSGQSDENDSDLPRSPVRRRVENVR